jgi:gamma-butyrobetaine dioxygenase
VTIDELLALYEGPAADIPYDEAVNEREHALQSAELAIADDAPDALVVAALLHDVGHLLPGTGRTALDDGHEAHGAAYLRGLFGPEVTAPVALHVAAKRYLCGTEPRYHDALSLGSQLSLEAQGGPMSSTEAAAFRHRPGWAGAVRVRRWDDAAKIEGAATRGLREFEPLLRSARSSS